MSKFFQREFGQAVRRALPGATGIVTGFILNAALASGQTPPVGAPEAPPQKALMAEDVFHNVQVLKGISVNEFMETMGFFSAALGYNCTNCHVEESLQSWAKFADDIPAKRRARGMILMVNSFNKNNFGGKRALDANLSFPGGIKQSLGRWRAGFPSTLIDDREVDVVEGTASQGTRVKLFFDKESGLLARLVRYTDTVVGFVPTQIDYSDYREVSGVKMPFKWTLTWTDGQSATELSDVRANVPVDAAKFTSPPVPATPRSRTAPR